MCRFIYLGVEDSIRGRLGDFALQDDLDLVLVDLCRALGEALCHVSFERLGPVV